MSNNPKISIIVPVFNTAQYLSRCLDSILQQTYKNTEVIVIDDGSTDDSPSICDRYAITDPRVLVIHQRNVGLAETRNRGIAAATGDFIAFVDSDDFIELDTYEEAIAISLQTRADIVCFGHIKQYETNRAPQYSSSRKTLRLFKPTEALEVMLFPQYIDVIICNKVVRRSLFANVTFPTGKYYEDMYTTYQLLGQATLIASMASIKYHYCQRSSGSISTMRFNTQTLDLADAVQHVYDYAKTLNCNMTEVICGYLFWNLVVANYMIKGQAVDKDFIERLQATMRLNRKKIYISELLTPIRKIQMSLFFSCFSIYRLLYLKITKEG